MQWYLHYRVKFQFIIAWNLMANTECVLDLKLKLTANYGVVVVNILSKADRGTAKCDSIIQNSTNKNVSINFSGAEAEELSQRTWLPVLWYFVLPVNQQPWCWQRGLNKPLWSIWKDLNKLCCFGGKGIQNANMMWCFLKIIQLLKARYSPLSLPTIYIMTNNRHINTVHTERPFCWEAMAITLDINAFETSLWPMNATRGLA